jgi:uncharacterized protein (DUF1810 family)
MQQLPSVFAIFVCLSTLPRPAISESPSCANYRDGECTRTQQPRMISSRDRKGLDALLSRQRTEMPRALAELETHARKRTHWAWWAFPTAKPGRSEPPPASYVVPALRSELLRYAPPEWKKVLQKICELVRASDDGRLGHVLPPIDHGRVKHFCSFWDEVASETEEHAWLVQVCVCLRRALR